MTSNSKKPIAWKRLTRRILLGMAAYLLLAAVGFLYSQGRTKGMGDFTEYSLAASRVLHAGGDPYDKKLVGRNYKYFPTNALILTPFAGMTNKVAEGFWFATNLSLLAWCFLLHRCWLGAQVRVPRWVWIVALAIMLKVLWTNLKLGQWNMSVYCLAFAGIAFLQRARHVTGGILTGLAATLKFTPLFFSVFYLLRRRWRPAVFIAGGMLLWTFLFPVMMLGPSRASELLGGFVRKATLISGDIHSGQLSSSVSVRSMAHRFVSPVGNRLKETVHYVNFLDLDRKTGSRVADGVALLLFAGFAVAIARIGRRLDAAGSPQPLAELLLVSSWFALLLMMSPGTRHAQIITLFTPCFAIAVAAANSPANSGERRLAVIALSVAAFCLIIPSEIVKGTTYQDLFEAHGCIAIAMLLLGITSLVLAARMAERSGAVPASNGPPPEVPTSH